MKFEYCQTDISDVCFDIIAEPANKAFTVGGADRINHITYNYFRRGFPSLHLMTSSPLMFIFEGLSFRAFNPVIESFNEVLFRLLSNGLMQKFLDDYQYPRDPNEKEDPIGPQVLTMDDLGVGFLICCIPLALSVVVFVAEVTVHLLICLWDDFRSKLATAFLVKAFFRK